LTSFRLALGGLALASLFAGASPAAAGQTGAARQRSLYVSVVDKDGKPVPDVKPDDLVVREDSVAREVLRVEPATEPMQLALLVDNSAAATDAIQYLRESLGKFVDTVTAKGHKVSLVTLANRPTLEVNATSDAAELKKKGTNRLFAQPNSGTYLLEAIMETTKGFSKSEAPRPVIVAVVTEGIEFSNQSYDLVIDTLKKAGVSFYALVLTEGAEANPSSDEVRNRNVVLDRGSRETGGHRETLITNMALAGELSKLATELVNVSTATYASPDRLIPAEKITVEAKRRELTARGIPVRAPAR
jgi:VWFA-related protein